MSRTKTKKMKFYAGIEALREEVFSYTFSRRVNFDEVSPAFREYSQLYGFDDRALGEVADYRLGALDYKGLRVLAHWWQLEKNVAKGTVCLVPGLFDHVGLYLKIIQFLLEEGYSVLAIDMPGHGLSEGPVAEIGDFSEYVAVLEKAIEKIIEKNTKEQLLLLGQSTGGAVVAHYLMSGTHKTRIEKSILLAPLLRPVRYWYASLGWLLAHRFIKSVPRKFAKNSSDKAFLMFLENTDPLQSSVISLKWVGAMRAWTKTFIRFSACDAPVLILQGDDDGTVDWKYNMPVFQKQFPNHKTVMLSGAKHHLANEIPQYMQAIFREIHDFLK